MIRKVVIRRFKRFSEVTFDLPDHIVLAGPNNTGKTTVLQAIAAWGLAFDRWKRLNDFHRHGGAYTKAPITRQTFSAVPLRAFDLLWWERAYQGTIEIEVQSVQGWTITMEFIADSTEQIYLRPKPSIDPATVRNATLATVFVPPMTGLSTDEPVYQPPKIDQLLGQARPGEVLRNLLVQAYRSEVAWAALQESIKRLFGYELLPPNAEGADILAEYTTQAGGTKLDIASAGSGFQQVLMLLTFLNTRPASVLLLDEPDAHLPTSITGQGLQRLRWKRYEIESYLLHPDALARYVEQMVGSGAASLHVQDLRKHFEETYPPAFLRDPLNDLPLLLGTKARTLLIPPALDAAGLPGIPYTRYHEIAAVMKPEEIHPEVVEKLNAIQQAFGL